MNPSALTGLKKNDIFQEYSSESKKKEVKNKKIRFGVDHFFVKSVK